MKFAGLQWRDGNYSLQQLPGEVGGAASFLADPRFRSVHVSDGYSDAFAVLSPSEALAIARAHYHDLARHWASVGKQAVAEDTLRKVEASLKDVDFVLAHIFEWESGLD